MMEIAKKNKNKKKMRYSAFEFDSTLHYTPVYVMQ